MSAGIATLSRILVIHRKLWKGFPRKLKEEMWIIRVLLCMLPSCFPFVQQMLMEFPRIRHGSGHQESDDSKETHSASWSPTLCLGEPTSPPTMSGSSPSNQHDDLIKMDLEGWALDRVAKLSFQTPTSHIRAPWIRVSAPLPVELFANAHSGRWQYLGPCPLHGWETQIEFLASVFSLA